MSCGFSCELSKLHTGAKQRLDFAICTVHSLPIRKTSTGAVVQTNEIKKRKDTISSDQLMLLIVMTNTRKI